MFLLQTFAGIWGNLAPFGSSGCILLSFDLFRLSLVQPDLPLSGLRCSNTIT